MDLISSRTIEITKLGMDGLLDRQQAISSNIANVVTPGYQRKEVAFESQLSEIIEKEDLKDYIKGQNSIEYKPPMVDVFTGDVHTYRTPTMQEKAYLQTNTLFDEFKPQYVTDVYSGTNADGNNVELEREMMDLSKTGTKYLTLSNLERKQFTNLSYVIQGQ
jgi:flagellar basal-body rod protein FlgB